MMISNSFLRAFFALVASLWSFVILPVAPAYAAILSAPDDPQETSRSSSTDANDETARTLAGWAQSAGSTLASVHADTDMSTVAGDQLRNAAAGAATAEVERWLSGFGTARVRLGVDRDFTLKNSDLDFLLPWYNAPEWVVFTQQSIHRTDDRTQMNLGAGVRHFGAGWMAGANAFYDYDLTRYHQRAGLGAELWRDYLKLGANGYFRLSGWRDAPELNNDYEARPANGWDLRAEGWLPAYPQVGGKLTYEQYYGKEVALFGTSNRQDNPQAITAGMNWTPVPLVTLSAEHSMGNGGMNDSRFGLQLTWTPGLSLAQQLDPDAVRERRTLAGSRLDLVERNNNIVLEYRKKALIKLALRERAEGTQGQVFTLVTGLQTKYPLQAIDWSAGDFLGAGGRMTGSGPTTQFTLPAWRAGANAAETSRLNTYIITAVARDSQGNRSDRAESTLIVKDTGVQILTGNLTVGSGARANGIDVNTVTAMVTDGAGRRVSGETVLFTLPAGLSVAGAVHSTQVRVTTDSNGVAKLDLISLTPGTYSLQAQVGTAPAVSTTTSFAQNTDTGPQEILNLEVTVPADNALANGQDRNTVSVVVKNPAGILQTNTVVHFSVTSGATLSSSDVTTDGNGVAQVTLTSVAANTYTVVAAAGGGSRTVPVTFSVVPLQGVLTASPASIPADNTTVSTLTLTLTDQNGTVQPGKPVVFGVTGVNGNATIISDTADHGNGIYTATLRGADTGTATVTAMISGVALSGAITSVTLTAPGTQFTLTATTHLASWNYAANSGFPKTGFTQATFTVNPPAGHNAAEYSWKVQHKDGSPVSWLSVDSTGIVTFNSEPTSATDASVEIIATPASGGVQTLGYQFALTGWFTSYSGSMNWTDATALCRVQGQRLPFRTNLSSGTTSDGVVGKLFSEWGGPSHYPGSGFIRDNYWTSEGAPGAMIYGINSQSGIINSYLPSHSLSVTCIRDM